MGSEFTGRTRVYAAVVVVIWGAVVVLGTVLWSRVHSNPPKPTVPVAALQLPTYSPPPAPTVADDPVQELRNRRERITYKPSEGDTDGDLKASYWQIGPVVETPEMRRYYEARTFAYPNGVPQHPPQKFRVAWVRSVARGIELSTIIDHWESSLQGVLTVEETQQLRNAFWEAQHKAAMSKRAMEDAPITYGAGGRFIFQITMMVMPREPFNPVRADLEIEWGDHLSEDAVRSFEKYMAGEFQKQRKHDAETIKKEEAERAKQPQPKGVKPSHPDIDFDP